MQVRTARIRPIRTETASAHRVAATRNTAELSWVGETVALVTYDDHGAVTAFKWVTDTIKGKQIKPLKAFAEAYGLANVAMNGGA